MYLHFLPDLRNVGILTCFSELLQRSGITMQVLSNLHLVCLELVHGLQYDLTLIKLYMCSRTEEGVTSRSTHLRDVSWQIRKPFSRAYTLGTSEMNDFESFEGPTAEFAQVQPFL